MRQAGRRDTGDFGVKGSGRDPYGCVLMASGEYACDNPFGFSTKYEDGETALAYYGYRYYAPGVGRWTRRDPYPETSFEVGPLAQSLELPNSSSTAYTALREATERSLYGCLGSNPINTWDALGLFEDVRVSTGGILYEGCFLCCDDDGYMKGAWCKVGVHVTIDVRCLDRKADEKRVDAVLVAGPETSISFTWKEDCPPNGHADVYVDSVELADTTATCRYFRSKKTKEEIPPSRTAPAISVDDVFAWEDRTVCEARNCLPGPPP